MQKSSELLGPRKKGERFLEHSHGKKLILYVISVKNNLVRAIYNMAVSTSHVAKSHRNITRAEQSKPVALQLCLPL